MKREYVIPNAECCILKMKPRQILCGSFKSLTTPYIIEDENNPWSEEE